MEKDEKYLVQLRDCFTAGYTLPQYCIDNGIKKPLFVSEKKYELFLWEVYVQFCCDKRMSTQFSVIDESDFSMDHSISNTYRPLNIKNFSEDLLNNCDKIFVLSSDKSKLKNQKAIFLNELIDYFIRKTYYEIPLLHFLQRYPKVKLIITNFPRSLERYKDGAKFKEQLKGNVEMLNLLKKRSGKIETPLDKFDYTNEQVIELMEGAQLKTNPDGSTIFVDNETKLLRRIKNGKRTTAYQPEHFQNKIYIFGTCHQYGVNAPYDKTIASYLQNLLNEHNLLYRVENEGQIYFGRHEDMFYNLNKLEPAPGDIIFIYVATSLPKNLPFCDVSDAFDPPHDFMEIFSDKWHVNELGYKLVAEKYFKFLTENNFFHEVCINYPTPPPIISQIRHTFLGRAGRRKNFCQFGTGAIQANFAGEKNFNRRNRHELQPLHARSSLSCRIRGGKSRAAVYFRRRRRSERISVRRQI